MIEDSEKLLTQLSQFTIKMVGNYSLIFVQILLKKVLLQKNEESMLKLL